MGGHKEAVGLWLLQRLPEVMTLPGGYEAIGVARGTELVGGALYTDYSPSVDGTADIRMWCAGQGWISRRVIRELLGYPFNQLRCRRITAVTAKKNAACRKMLKDLGFKLEGVARQGFGKKSDAMIYGLLRDECRWI